jgi:hypothetical protein
MADRIAKIQIMFWLFMVGVLFGAPPRQIPPELYDEYTLKGRIPIHNWYIDGTSSNHQPTLFLKKEIEEFIAKALRRENGYYGSTDGYLYTIFDRYKSSIKGKNIAIIGSTIPWYEAIILSYGGHPTTIEYNRIVSDDLRCHFLTVDEYDKNPLKFDAIVSISSIEHDGLGRYGDPINPWGDVETMKKLLGMLKKTGLFFLSVPVGKDALYWNAHRVYGRLRLPLLFAEWEVVDSAGFAESDLVSPGYHQPVFVLRPKN